VSPGLARPWKRCPASVARQANVVLNSAFGEPVIAVDTHIFRVANRTNLAPGEDVVEVERKLDKFTPDEFKRNAHHWLILHGRYVCVARKPKCPECLIRDLCEFRHKTPGQGAFAPAGLTPCSTLRATKRAASSSTRGTSRATAQR
jgi:endonuclease-3